MKPFEFDLNEISALAHLEIPNEERERLIKDMRAIVAFADKLKINNSVTQDLSTLNSAKNTELRRDEIIPPLSAGSILSSAPESKDGYISVTRTVTKNEDLS